MYVAGGGVNGQAGAIRLGISRALVEFNAELRRLHRELELRLVDGNGRVTALLQRYAPQSSSLVGIDLTAAAVDAEAAEAVMMVAEDPMAVAPVAPVAIGMIVGNIRDCVPPEGLPICDLERYLYPGALIGLVLGGSQALSRSLFAQMIPKGKEAEYFGLSSCAAAVAVFGMPRTLRPGDDSPHRAVSFPGLCSDRRHEAPPDRSFQGALGVPGPGTHRRPGGAGAPSPPGCACCSSDMDAWGAWSSRLHPNTA